MSETPRTDAQEYSVGDIIGQKPDPRLGPNVVDSDFARSLERDLRECVGWLKETAEQLDAHLGDSDLDHFETVEEMEEEVPLQWLCLKINQLLVRLKVAP